MSGLIVNRELFIKCKLLWPIWWWENIGAIVRELIIAYKCGFDFWKWIAWNLNLSVVILIIYIDNKAQMLHLLKRNSPNNTTYSILSAFCIWIMKIIKLLECVSSHLNWSDEVDCIWRGVFKITLLIHRSTVV